MTARVRSLLVLLASLAPTLAAAQGAIEGRVRIGTAGIPHVTVELVELKLLEETDPQGRYRFRSVPDGTYTIALRLGDFETIERGIVVDRRVATRDTMVTWPLTFIDTVTVTAPARFPERIVDTASAAITIGEPEIRSQAASGQLPRLLAFTPGIELTQSGLYDFNLNTRGFNMAVNRHVKTLIDGRDPSVPIVPGYQDWAANSMPLDEIEHLEFIRGPGAALYGAGAFSGVLSITTTAPRDSLGGFARFTVGELSTRRVEARHAVALGQDWYLKASGGYHHSGDFTRARVAGTEYGSGALPLEIVAPPRDRLEIAFGTVRLDKYLGPRTVTTEFGTSQVEGLTTVTRAGRTQAGDSSRPWAGLNVASPRWTARLSYSGQNADDQIGLNTGAPVFFNASDIETEFVANQTIAGGRSRVVAGVSFGWQNVNSADEQGQQTVFAAPQHVNRQAVFGQIEYRVTDQLRSVASGRWDRSSLHSAKFSPRGAVVYRFPGDQTIRFSASRAFQSPTVTEVFLSTAIAPPADLSPLEAALAPLLGGTPLNFQRIPFLAVGNENLQVEKVSAIEGAYGVLLGRRAYVTVTVYRNWLTDFTSNLLPQAGTPLGRLNPDFGAYRPPASLSPAAAAAVQAGLAAALPPELLALLSTDASGAPIFAALSWKSFGAATTHGIEAAMNYAIAPRWRLDASYTFFGYHVKDDLPVAALSANTPQHQWNAAATYDDNRLSASLRYRWADGFLWSSGIFAGPVPAYGVADLNLMYALSPSMRVGLDIANLSDNSHYEMFGGDLLGRRALASVRYSW